MPQRMSCHVAVASDQSLHPLTRPDQPLPFLYAAGRVNVIIGAVLPRLSDAKAYTFSVARGVLPCLEMEVPFQQRVLHEKESTPFSPGAVFHH